MVMPFLASYVQGLGITDVGEVALWTGLTLGVTPAVAGRSIRIFFLLGAAILTTIVLMVQRLMAERDPAIETPPSVDES